MSDLIRRDEVIKAIKPIVNTLPLGYHSDFASAINSIPSAEPKVGRWIEQPPYKPFTDDDMEIFVAPKCSLCGKHGNFSNYCPNCGAKMDEEKDDED
jgi:hypothetical protein